jgi:hypothetical protein
VATKKKSRSSRRTPFDRARLDDAISDWKARQRDGNGTLRQLQMGLRGLYKSDEDAEKNEELSWFLDAMRTGLATAANLRRLEKILSLPPHELDLDEPEPEPLPPGTPRADVATYPAPAMAATLEPQPAPPAAALLPGLAQSINPLSALGFFVLLAIFLIALWIVLPLKVDLPWTVMLAMVGAASGALVWHYALLVLKKYGLEPAESDSFGGRNEVQLFGGITGGLSYYLPLAVLLAMVDVNSHGLRWGAAAWANVAFLLGTASGSAVFHGLRIRHRTDAFGWSHLKHESVLVLTWSSLLFGGGFLFYCTAAALATTRPLLEIPHNALLITLLPVVLCFCTIFLFICVCVTPQNLREDVRGAINGIMSMFAVTLAHELYWAVA